MSSSYASSSCKSELKIFYLDDGTLCGDTKTVLSDYKKIQIEAATLGLEVNPSRTPQVLSKFLWKYVIKEPNQMAVYVDLLA